MPTVEIYLDNDPLDDDELIFEGEFDFLPRVGESIARDTAGYFKYYDVVKVWHRQVGVSGAIRACLLVEIDD